jgi:NTE family protein
MRWGAILISLALGACASAPAAVNAPSAAAFPAEARESDAGADLILLALSGGGARAASFQLGVLQGLRDTPGADGRALTRHIALITSVSGGSVLAAYYGLHGEAGLESFRAAYLDKNWTLASFYAPPTWLRTWQGGANGAARLADWLDRELYDGARLGAIREGPRIILNAADLANATPFAFTSLFFGPLCSDVREVRVADAVAASMAVPLVFRPIAIETFPDRCAADLTWAARADAARETPEMIRATARALQSYDQLQRQRFVRLVDGGVADNFGVTTLSVMRAALPAPEPLTPRETVRARRVLVLVINAERVIPPEWAASGEAPSGGDVLAGTLDVATDASKRAALDAFRASLDEVAQDWIAYRCGLSAEDARALGAGDDWACADLSVTMEMITIRDAGPDAPADLLATPTLVTLPADRVDALIAGGRYAVTHNAAVRALTRE